MGPISGFTVALPFLIVILVFMVKQLELNHIRTRRKTELTILAQIFKESFKNDDTGAGESARSYFIKRLKDFEADGKFSKNSSAIIVDELSKMDKNPN